MTSFPPQPFRQVHLDFHTSEHIPEVGVDFDPDAFAATLRAAHVESVQLFARCWHGWMYYDSAAFPERVHPQLARRDLLERQIAACHAAGIRAPIYVAVQRDRYSVDRHPEWVQLRADGRLGESGVFEPGFGAELCVGGPFGEFLFRHVEEILQRMPVDGFWFDGLTPQNCCCRHCREDMRAAGRDPADEAQRRAFGGEVVRTFAARMAELVRRHAPAATMFFNGGHVGPRHRAMTDSHTHFEIESLPGGGWGYLHFPVAARLARTMGREVVGMNGKFHTSWGDFHSFRNEAALEFECFQMLAHGARCSIGDQLHPRGRLCAETYRLIGDVFSAVAAVEPWCRGAEPLAEAALLTSEGNLQAPWDELLPPPVLGATRLLQELAVQFDIVERAGPWEQYPLVILPDDLTCDDALAARLDAYVAHGGRILAAGLGGWRVDGTAPAVASLPVRAGSQPEWKVDFLAARDGEFPDLPRVELVMARGAKAIVPNPGAAILADVLRPYFDRTAEHFCSHRHAPSTGERVGPAVVAEGNVIYAAHPLFRIFHADAPRWIKRVVATCLDRLTGGRMVTHDGPSNLQVAVHAQPAEHRTIVHLLHYIPERRTPHLDIIEDRLSLRDLTVTLRLSSPVTRVRTAPTGEPLAWKFAGGDAVRITVPRLDGRLLLEITHAPSPS